MKRTLIIIIVIIIVLLTLFIIFKGANDTSTFVISDYNRQINDFSAEKILGDERKLGKVIDSKDAKVKAEIIWNEVYGADVLNKKPYISYWDEDSETWLVTGSISKSMDGGIPYIIINKSDGLVLAVWHDK